MHGGTDIDQILPQHLLFRQQSGQIGAKINVVQQSTRVTVVTRPIHQHAERDPPVRVITHSFARSKMYIGFTKDVSTQLFAMPILGVFNAFHPSNATQGRTEQQNEFRHVQRTVAGKVHQFKDKAYSILHGIMDQQSQSYKDVQSTDSALASTIQNGVLQIGSDCFLFFLFVFLLS